MVKDCLAPFRQLDKFLLRSKEFPLRSLESFFCVERSHQIPDCVQASGGIVNKNLACSLVENNRRWSLDGHSILLKKPSQFVGNSFIFLGLNLMV